MVWPCAAMNADAMVREGDSLAEVMVRRAVPRSTGTHHLPWPGRGRLAGKNGLQPRADYLMMCATRWAIVWRKPRSCSCGSSTSCTRTAPPR
jgi:hypothetical protein